MDGPSSTPPMRRPASSQSTRGQNQRYTFLHIISVYSELFCKETSGTICNCSALLFPSHVDYFFFDLSAFAFAQEKSFELN